MSVVATPILSARYTYALDCSFVYEVSRVECDGVLMSVDGRFIADENNATPELPYALCSTQTIAVDENMEWDVVAVQARFLAEIVAAEHYSDLLWSGDYSDYDY